MSDLIERDKAINILDRIDVDIIPYADTRKYVQSAIDHIRKELENMPSARPKGEWIDRGMRVPSSRVKKCSLCGHETDTWRWCKFCPNCGADMREREGE